ncbi:unnamed protein product [Soboliphyme baturini]|uniref:AA_permease domain-containing protein n=1 Tax=Soboliphyme baturini TaxID=241478 RepID=A0A183IYD3_9BILA|nr:unnamed protein product [Soboliphyme baturini]
MISRNLGAEFGSAVGILFYLANAVACSMYLIGTTEVLLTYVAPSLPQVGNAEQRTAADMINNFRIYGTLILLLVFAFCAMGVRFVQFFAPISLSCVIMSILAIWAGAFAADYERSPRICMLGDRLIKVERANRANLTELCTKNDTGLLWPFYCKVANGTTTCDPYFVNNKVRLVPAIPGFRGDIITIMLMVFSDNAFPAYMSKDEVVPDHKGNPRIEVVQDIATSFFILLAIYFPSVTGIMTGSNMSGDLKDPQRSIPLGTLAAQISTSFVYLSFVIVFGGTIERPLLWDKCHSLTDDVFDFYGSKFLDMVKAWAIA